jgi:hypothetical protein
MPGDPYISYIIFIVNEGNPGILNPEFFVWPFGKYGGHFADGVNVNSIPAFC